MAAADSGSRRRFAVACGVLSRCVKAEVAGKMAAAHPAAATAASTMLLMPGADVGEEAEGTPAGGNGQAQAQLTIMYGGRVLVFDDFPADRVAELVRVAAAAGQDVASGGFADLPVARKASLQRFMEKRRERLGARAPYAGRRSSPAAAAKKGKEEKVAEAECWLGLGTQEDARRGDTPCHFNTVAAVD